MICEAPACGARHMAGRLLWRAPKRAAQFLSIVKFSPRPPSGILSEGVWFSATSCELSEGRAEVPII